MDESESLLNRFNSAQTFKIETKSHLNLVKIINKSEKLEHEKIYVNMTVKI